MDEEARRLASLANGADALQQARGGWLRLPRTLLARHRHLPADPAARLPPPGNRTHRRRRDGRDRAPRRAERASCGGAADEDSGVPGAADADSGDGRHPQGAPPACATRCAPLAWPCCPRRVEAACLDGAPLPPTLCARRLDRWNRVRLLRRCPPSCRPLPAVRATRHWRSTTRFWAPTATAARRCSSRRATGRGWRGCGPLQSASSGSPASIACVFTKIHRGSEP